MMDTYAAPSLARPEEHGQTLAEYAAVLSVITIAIIAVFALLSDAVVDRILATVPLI